MSGLDVFGVMLLDGTIESWLYVSLGGEHIYNHVDRVRVRQQSSTPPGCPIPGSRRRPSLASHLDLATTNPAHKYYSHLQFGQRQSDCSNNSNKNHLNLQDYYSHIQGEDRQQYEEHYYESYANNCRSEENCHRLKENASNDICSLRRTRSLAVIREETYNDLQISSARNSRRSQLIPRAKLVNRSLIKERYNRSKRQKRDEDSTAGSGVDTQTSETRESDDYYSNLKRLDSVKIFKSSRHHDRSDLDSINSDYFKNSQHQQEHPVSTDSTLLRSSGDNQFQVLEIELHQESSLLPETTTSNSDHSDYSATTHERYSRTRAQSDNKYSSDGTLTLNRNTLEAEGKPFIAYDSVYLSSEDSSGGTLLRTAAADEIISTAETGSLVKRSIQTKESIEGLYTKVNKASGANTKPKILSVTTKRGALERLTSISTSQILKTNDVRVIDSYRTILRNNHYCSLPDINIGRSLKASEKIDAKLRSSYKHYPEDGHYHHQNIPLNGSTLRKGKRARQRDFSEIDSLASANISLISIDDSSITNYSYNDETSEIQAEKQQSEIEYGEETLPSEKVVNAPEHTSQHEHLSSTTSSQTGFLLNQTTLNFPGQFRIVVTDSQDNIIEEDSIESSIDKALEPPDGNNNCSEWEDFNRSDNSFFDEAENSKETRQTIDIHPRRLEHKTDKKTKSEDKHTTQCEQAAQQPTCCPIKGILKKDCDRRGKAEIHFPPPPPISCSPLPDPHQSFQDILQADSASSSHRACSNDEKVIIRNLIGSKMSRPQILHVVDSKRQHPNSKDGRNGNVEKEFLERVDSVRCYWSKITNNENESTTTGASSNANNLERNYVHSLEDQVDGSETEPVAMTYLTSSLKPGSVKTFEHGLDSFSPTVEIIELNGEKQATIVKARNADEPDFDHVRYKIMKPNQFQKDILNRSKKEAQFDGLIQYLQDYSFQELLSNNNIVIIEPVRTKIEKPAEAAAKLEPLNCKITGGSGETKASTSKRHFFYQPVRVNRELLEEELPNPDTVRNVRKFFEEHVLRKQSAGATTKSNTLDSLNSGKRRTLRYLTIDTSYGNGALRKWDSASLSSGISSGDLSSPCECNEDPHHNEPHHHHHQQQQQHRHNGHVKGGRGGFVNEDDDGQDIYTSEENLCEDDMCGSESYYVSEDVLEKIRECGSTVTYYGGRVVNKSPEFSPMTRAIMEEIHGKDINVDGSIRKTLAAEAVAQETRRTCNACQPDTFHQQDDIDDIERRYRDNKHLGIQFKLVKSNSCSSRLELVGTEKCCAGQPHVNGTCNNSPSPTCHPEESVRELVNRLELGTIKNSSAPRIIESKCIEKSYRQSLPQPTKTATTDPENGITINNHHIDTKEYLGLVDIINHVTVNNHLGYNSPASNEKSNVTSSTGTNKVPRNKNVDLAFTMCRNNSQTSKTAPDATNLSVKSIKFANHHEKPGESETIDSNPNNMIANEINQDTIAVADVNQIDPQSTRISLEKNIPASEPESHTEKNTISLDKNKVESVVITNGSAHVPIPKKVSNNDLSALSSLNGGAAPIKLLEKHYVANDKRLIEQRKYDEIEFEEFEVYSPEMAYQAIANSNPKNNGHETHNLTKQQTNGIYRSPAEIVESFEEKI